MRSIPALVWIATFCALAFSVGKFVVDYVSTAQVDQLAVVSNARGRVLVVPPGSAEQTVLTRSELGVGTTFFFTLPVADEA